MTNIKIMFVTTLNTTDSIKVGSHQCNETHSHGGMCTHWFRVYDTLCGVEPLGAPLASMKNYSNVRVATPSVPHAVARPPRMEPGNAHSETRWDR